MMLKLLSIAGSVLVLLFGVMGVGAAAAQNSQVGEPLYAFKALAEPVRFMLQTREQTQMQSMNGSAQTVLSQGLQNQIRLQTQDRLQLHQLLEPTATVTGDQERDQTQDQIHLQTQDRLRTQDCVQDPQGSTAQNRYGNSRKP
ncbi:MAG TPA: hypothetical protein VIN60_06205 [Anaerolineales bacterium]